MEIADDTRIVIARVLDINSPLAGCVFMVYGCSDRYFKPFFFIGKSDFFGSFVAAVFIIFKRGQSFPFIGIEFLPVNLESERIVIAFYKIIAEPFRRPVLFFIGYIPV